MGRPKHRITLPCAFCRNPVERPASQMLRSEDVFCNKHCKWKKYHADLGHNPVVGRCAYCGADVRRSPALVKNNKDVFCNPEHYHAFRPHPDAEVARDAGGRFVPRGSGGVGEGDSSS